MFFTTLWVKIKRLAILILFVLMVKHINVLNIAFPLKNLGHIQSIRLVKDCVVISFLVEGKKSCSSDSLKMMKRLFLKVHFSSSDGPQCKGTDMGRI